MVIKNTNDRRLRNPIPPPNISQVWGYPHVGGQNIQLIPILFLLTSYFMFWTYQGLKKLVWVSCERGGGLHVGLLWPNNCIGLLIGQSRIYLRKEPRKQVKIYLYRLFLPPPSPCWPTSVQYLPVNCAASCFYDVAQHYSNTGFAVYLATTALLCGWSYPPPPPRRASKATSQITRYIGAMLM